MARLDMSTISSPSLNGIHTQPEHTQIRGIVGTHKEFMFDTSQNIFRSHLANEFEALGNSREFQESMRPRSDNILN